MFNRRLPIKSRAWLAKVGLAAWLAVGVHAEITTLAPDPAAQERLSVIQRMGKSAVLSPTDLQMLSEALADNDPRVDQAAADLLKRQHPFPKSLRPRLSALLADPRISVRRESLELLAYVPRPFLESEVTLMLSVVQNDPDAGVRALAMRRVANEWPPNPRTYKKLIPLAWDSNEFTRCSAVEALGDSERSRLHSRGMRYFSGITYVHPKKIRLAVKHPLTGRAFSDFFRGQFPLPVWWNREASSDGTPATPEELQRIVTSNNLAGHPCFRADLMPF